MKVVCVMSAVALVSLVACSEQNKSAADAESKKPVVSVPTEKLDELIYNGKGWTYQGEPRESIADIEFDMEKLHYIVDMPAGTKMKDLKGYLFFHPGDYPARMTFKVQGRTLADMRFDHEAFLMLSEDEQQYAVFNLQWATDAEKSMLWENRVTVIQDGEEPPEDKRPIAAEIDFSRDSNPQLKEYLQELDRKDPVVIVAAAVHEDLLFGRYAKQVSVLQASGVDFVFTHVDGKIAHDWLNPKSPVEFDLAMKLPSSSPSNEKPDIPPLVLRVHKDGSVFEVRGKEEVHLASGFVLDGEGKILPRDAGDRPGQLGGMERVFERLEEYKSIMSGSEKPIVKLLSDPETPEQPIVDVLNALAGAEVTSVTFAESGVAEGDTEPLVFTLTDAGVVVEGLAKLRMNAKQFEVRLTELKVALAGEMKARVYLEVEQGVTNEELILALDLMEGFHVVCLVKKGKKVELPDELRERVNVVERREITKPKPDTVKKKPQADTATKSAGGGETCSG